MEQNSVEKWVKFVKGGAWTQPLLTGVNTETQSPQKSIQKHVQPNKDTFLSLIPMESINAFRVPFRKKEDIPTLGFGEHA